MWHDGGATHFQLDRIFLLPNGKDRPAEEAWELIRTAVEPEKWVASGGGYRIGHDIVWARATAVIWLNYSFPVVFYRTSKRTIEVFQWVLKRIISRGVFHNISYAGEKESRRIKYLITRYRILRRWYRTTIAGNEFPDLVVVEFQKPN